MCHDRFRCRGKIKLCRRCCCQYCCRYWCNCCCCFCCSSCCCCRRRRLRNRRGCNSCTGRFSQVGYRITTGISPMYCTICCTPKSTTPAEYLMHLKKKRPKKSHKQTRTSVCVCCLCCLHKKNGSGLCSVQQYLQTPVLPADSSDSVGRSMVVTGNMISYRGKIT